MARHAAIVGWGHYLPEHILTNKDLEKLVETTDAWIQSRTGILERRIAAPEESTTSLCVAAAQRALDSARLKAGDLDLIICASTTPDHLLPATGCVVQKKLGADHVPAFDLNAACTGFLYALVTGAQFIKSGTSKRILIVCGETLSRFVNWKDRNTCVLFGDGAGAVVLEATEQECGVLNSVLGCQGDEDHLLAIEAGGAARPSTAETVARGEHYITMRGNDIFRYAVRSMTHVTREVLGHADLAMSDIRMFIPHQANLRILRATQETLDLPLEKMYVNLDRFGNAAAASIPIALSEYLTNDPVPPGENLLLAAFGGGLTWGAVLVRCADVEAIISQRCRPSTAVAAGKEFKTILV